jgi:hypothetical protein
VPGENFVLLVDVARANFRVNPFLHGSARWADLSDIKAAGLLNNDGVYVGAWRVKGVKSTTCGTPALSTSLCYAPTRSGKGVGLIVGSFDERGNKVRQARRVELHPTAFALLERVRGGSERLFA